MSNEAEQEKLLARWLSGELSPEEQKQLEAEGGLDDLQFAMDDLKRWKVPDMDTAKGLEDVMDRAFQQPAQKKSKQVFFQPLLRIAASLLLIVGAYFVINNLLGSGVTTITTEYGETLNHTLPDGSIVNLDGHSTISYKKSSWEEERILNMTGRALFNVEKGSSFKVDTKSGSVTVLGTIFDVERQETDLLRVNCYEGRVRVDFATVNARELLNAGQSLIYDNKEVTRMMLEEATPRWVDQIKSYNNTPLNIVIEELERYHNVSITLPAQYASERFQGDFFYGDLDQALTSLTGMFQMKYTRPSEGKIIFE
jgi:ferric-dicitrate binding protein FerR (iron transport regulator)